MKKGSMPPDGTVFLVPLSNDFAVGVLFRSDGKGRAYGVFYGPRVAGREDVAIADLRPEGGILRCRFGDHGLHTGRWPVIGQIPSWNQEVWVLPKFWRAHDRIDLCYITEYDDKLNVLSEAITSKDQADGLPYDAQYGSGIVEVKLDKLLQ